MAANEFSLLDELELPPLTVDNIDEEGMTNLAHAVVLDACKRYNRCVHVMKKPEKYLRKGSKTLNTPHAVFMHALKEKEELVTFFRSGWFHLLAGEDVDGDAIMHMLENDPARKWLTLEERKELDERTKGEADKEKDA